MGLIRTVNAKNNAWVKPMTIICPNGDKIEIEVYRCKKNNLMRLSVEAPKNYEITCNNLKDSRKYGSPTDALQ